MEATSTVPLVIEAANNVTIAATVIVLAIIDTQATATAMRSRKR